MEELRMEHIDGNDFKLYVDNEYIGRIDSPKWYSWLTRDVTTADGSIYTLRPGFWGFESELRFDGKLLLEISFDDSLKGIVFKENGILAYAMKGRQHFFKSNMVLVNEIGSALLMIQSKFNWREFETKYTIAISEGFGNSDLEKAIIILVMMFYDSLHDDND